MKVEVVGGATWYIEGDYRIEMTNGSDPNVLMFVYHEIKAVLPCIILNSEMKKQVCVNHGPLKVPDSLQTLWILFHIDGGNR